MIFYFMVHKENIGTVLNITSPLKYPMRLSPNIRYILMLFLHDIDDLRPSLSHVSKA